MSVHDHIAEAMRKATGSARGLGRTITYRPARSARGDRGNSWGPAATLTGTFVEQSSAIAIEGAKEINERSAILRTADTETALAIGDRVEMSGVAWAVVGGPQTHAGHLQYDLQGDEELQAGMDRS